MAFLFIVRECVVSHFSHVQPFVTLWPVAHQAPLSMGSRQEYWSELPFPSPGNLPNPGIEPSGPGSHLLPPLPQGIEPRDRILHCRRILYYLRHQGSPKEVLQAPNKENKAAKVQKAQFPLAFREAFLKPR